MDYLSLFRGKIRISLMGYHVKTYCSILTYGSEVTASQISGLFGRGESELTLPAAPRILATSIHIREGP